ncbi:MAG: adenylate/guanylate cyclase domain-containing protein [Ilumatobacteraceae bacterium]|nr:adenylate/guanylate cyclase domain-containing protein [Ilumatobacteraceae bacterium]
MTTERRTSATDRDSLLATYVPRLVEDHHRSGSNEQLLFASGTLVSADISGFTALSERLAAFGHEGAEELTDLLNRCFTEMIAACERRDGDIVKFGGDALLVLFGGERHAEDAAEAMSAMHTIVSRSWSTESVKRVELGISQGAHSGTIGCSLADAGHLELLVGGPTVSMTVRCEGDAARGEILVSEATARLLPASWLGEETDGGAWQLARRRVQHQEDSGARSSGRRGLAGLGRYLPAALADQIVAGVPGEHRQVVVAFVNMTGTDDLFAADGADAVNEASQRLAANVRQVLGNHPIHLLASDVYVNGTKLILAAGAPTSTDADEDHMLLGLRELFSLETTLPIRAGVNRGHVFVGDLGGPTRRTLTVMGDAVNLAARLMQRAEPGQIIVSRQVLGRADTKFDIAELPPFHVKGKSEPIRAAVLGDALSVDDADHVSHVGFVGRADERTRLDLLADAALAGRGSVVDIVGEPGIGKSRLADETLLHHPGLRVHRMRGGQYAKNTPFFMIRGLLRDVLQLHGQDPADLGEQLIAWSATNAPELMRWLPLLALPVGAEVGMTSAVERLADEFRRDRMLSVTADAIDRALREPTAVLAEDVHLFDPGSVDVLCELARRVAQRSTMIVMTRRTGSEGLALGSEVPLETVSLTSLGVQDVVDLLAAAGVEVGVGDTTTAASDVEALVERAAGNPLFVLELVAALEEGSGDALPESIESLITTRIDLLPPRDRVLLRDVSVGGNTVDAPLLATAFDQPELESPDRWASLGSFLVPEGPGIYRFRQSIYRDVAYEGLAYRRRRQMHLAIGTTLERRRGSNLTTVMPLLSDHFDRARDHERAWIYSVAGGESARRTFANAEAVTLFERALRNAQHVTAADEAARARVAESLGDVHELMGHYPEAFAAYQESRARDAGSEHQARLLRKIGEVRLNEGRLSQSLSWLTRAVRAVEQIDNARARDLETAETARLRAGALHRQGRLRLCAAQAELAAESAERTGDQLAMARAFNMVEVAYRTLGRPDAARYSDLALEMFAGSGDLVGEANVLNNRGVRHHFDGQWRSAIAEYERSRTLRRQAGDVVGEAMVANNIGEILSLQGRHDEAVELFEHASAAWQQAGFTVGVPYAGSNLAMTMARSGDPERGITLLDEATVALSELGASALVNEMAVRRVECQLLRGHTASALSLAEAIERRLTSEAGDDQLLVQLLPMLGLAQVRSGDAVTAADTLRRALDSAREANDRYTTAITLMVWDELDRPTGDPRDGRRAEATQLLEQLDVIAVPAIVGRNVPSGEAPVDPGIERGRLS